MIGAAVAAAAVAVTAVPSVAVAATPSLTTPPTAQDRLFLKTSIAGDLFEIDMGRIAEKKAVYPTTRAYAAKLVSDHLKSVSDARTIASALGIPSPTKPDAKEQQEIADISSHSGTAFDLAYLRGEVTDHFGDIAGGIKELERGANTRIRRGAADDLPMLRYHLWRGQLDLRYVLWRVH
jgi:putative membrane protein